MFYICFIRDGFNKTQYSLLHICSSLEEARKKRFISGDLVFDEQGQIVQDKTWLWDWEKPVSYASRCIEDKVSIDVSPHILKENDKRFLKDKNGQFKFF